MDLRPTAVSCLFVRIHMELSMQASHRTKNLLESYEDIPESKLTTEPYEDISESKLTTEPHEDIPESKLTTESYEDIRI
jgi:hypothetical protein